MKKKKIKRIGLMICSMLAIGAVWLLYRELMEPETRVKLVGHTSVNPVVYNTEAFQNLLEKDYSTLFASLTAAYPVPGLVQSPTVVTATGKETMVADMDPQGIIRADEYIIISAYSESRTHNSVLWLLHAQTGQFLQTVVLPDKAHVGGIAYDDTHRNLWIANEHAMVSVVQLDRVLASDIEKTKKPLTYDASYQLEDIALASYMTYYKEQLFVGYFDIHGKSKLDVYHLSKDGLLQKLDNRVYPDAQVTTLDQLQGMSIDENTILFSQSYGDVKSRLLVYDNPGVGQWTSFGDENLREQMDLPPYLEEIDLVNQQLYLIFESASKRYRNRDFQPAMDRILVVDFAALIKE